MKPLLAVGSQMKNTVALAWDERVVVSPHIGELDSLRGYQIFQQVVQDLQDLYQVQAAQIVCDAHPSYTATRWAKRRGLPLYEVYHHHAHASALYGEYQQAIARRGDTDNWLVFTWDGVGLGADGGLWGGETFLGQPGGWQRVAHLRPFGLPGGEQAARQPWRSAAAVCWEAGLAVPQAVQARADFDLLYAAWQRGLNCLPTTAAGRLFDAAASLCGVLHEASFEGQAAMQLEALCDGQPLPAAWAVPWQMNEQGLWEAQWQTLLAVLLEKNATPAEKATLFHVSLARAIVDLSVQLGDLYRFSVVGLCGGVFQNRLLTEAAMRWLQQAGFTVLLPEKLPCNDAAISVGQIVEVRALLDKLVLPTCV